MRYVLLIICLVVMDQGSKLWVRHNLPLEDFEQVVQENKPHAWKLDIIRTADTKQLVPAKLVLVNLFLLATLFFVRSRKAVAAVTIVMTMQLLLIFELWSLGGVSNFIYVNLPFVSMNFNLADIGIFFGAFSITKDVVIWFFRNKLND